MPKLKPPQLAAAASGRPAMCGVRDACWCTVCAVLVGLLGWPLPAVGRPAVVNANGSLWSIPSSHGHNCERSLQRRADGGDVIVISPSCFANPMLSLHTMQSGLSPELCGRLIQAAERVDKWGAKSAFGAGVVTKDAPLTWLIDHLSPEDVLEIERFLGQRMAAFVIDHLLLKRPELDGLEGLRPVDPSKPHETREQRQLWPAGGFPYDQVVTLKGMPMVVKYDVAPGGAPGLMKHKDNSDASFILLLSDEADFGGGGTLFEALGDSSPIMLRRGEAAVFNGQLVHSAAPITSGKRYVLSGFMNFSEEYMTMKRKMTLDTSPYFH